MIDSIGLSDALPYGAAVFAALFASWLTSRRERRRFIKDKKTETYVKFLAAYDNCKSYRLAGGSDVAHATEVAWREAIVGMRFFADGLTWNRAGGLVGWFEDNFRKGNASREELDIERSFRARAEICALCEVGVESEDVYQERDPHVWGDYLAKKNGFEGDS